VSERALVLLLAVGLDVLAGEPPSVVHPVVWIGRLVASIERRAPIRGVVALGSGALLTLATVGASTLGGWLLALGLRPLPRPLRVLLGALALKPTFAVRALFEAGEAVRAALAADDLPAARRALASLCSRDASELCAEQVASGAIESLAENAVDSAIAPGLAYLVGGLPAAYGYRAANTLDAMIGYHGRYELLGRCAARLDDLLNLVPARLAAGVVLVGAALGGGAPCSGFDALRRDHGATESPNAGWPMSAMAGALGVRLEKPGQYRLGDATRAIQAADIAGAQRIVARGLMAALGLIALAGVVWRRAGAAA